MASVQSHLSMLLKSDTPTSTKDNGQFLSTEDDANQTRQAFANALQSSRESSERRLDAERRNLPQERPLIKPHEKTRSAADRADEQNDEAPSKAAVETLEPTKIEKDAETVEVAGNWLELLAEMQQQLQDDGVNTDDKAALKQAVEELLENIPEDAKQNMRQLFAEFDVTQLQAAFQATSEQLAQGKFANLAEIQVFLRQQLAAANPQVTLTDEQSFSALQTMIAAFAADAKAQGKLATKDADSQTAAAQKLLAELMQLSPKQLQTNMSDTALGSNPNESKENSTTNLMALLQQQAKRSEQQSSSLMGSLSQLRERLVDESGDSKGKRVDQQGAEKSTPVNQATTSIAQGAEQQSNAKSATNGQMTEELVMGERELGRFVNADSARTEAASELRNITQTQPSQTQQIREPVATTGKPLTAPQSFGELMRQAQQAFELDQATAPQQLRERLMMMSSNGIQRADIRLDPPDLGSMSIRVQVQNDQAQVTFQVQNPQARDMLDQALPRLREMMAEQGIQLTDGQVNDQQQQAQQQSGNSGERSLADDQAPEWQLEVALNTSEPLTPGRVDFYA